MVNIDSEEEVQPKKPVGEVKDVTTDEKHNGSENGVKWTWC